MAGPGATWTDLAEQVGQLHAALRDLEAEAACLPIAALSGRDWFDVLERKLLPQLGADAWLVVAVTGGTNIGKSVVFNHLAGFRASASSPLASGTKHPVCLLPERIAARGNFSSLFPGFVIREWNSSQDALSGGDEDLLFWRSAPQVPENLLLLDTPDIDSDAPVNWRRADAVRQAADVLIAVLTQQKYNDAAVKQFFRKAAAEDKAVIVVFNQCQLPEDESYWPIWLRTFCEETGLSPELVYVAPNNRQAAESLTLPFYERSWPTDAEPAASGEVSLQQSLSSLRFSDIKLRTLRGALSQVTSPGGVEEYLTSLRLASADYRSAAELLTAHRLAEIDHWPTPPTALLIQSIQEWWRQQRTGWSASVHGFYNVVGHLMATPVRYAHTWINGPAESPWDVYRRQEWDAILKAVEKVYERLQWLTELGQELLRRHLDPVLAGTTRASLLERLSREHGEIEFATELNGLVAGELDEFRRENTEYFQFFRKLDVAAAAARPGLSVVLGLTGFGWPFGDAATHIASHAVWQSALHVAGDVASGTVAAAVGETAITTTASSGISYLQARFHRLQAAFTARRAAWLAERLERDLLGQTTRQLIQAVGVPQCEPFQRTEDLLQQLRASLPGSVGTMSRNPTDALHSRPAAT
ncbi:MAG: GTPase [Planctomycetaceae bacterium]